ncbi:hypothetical protein LJC46_07375 [Desulfovibrio sp. OttesenSCG-928-G15]|nr:hypothetical protein [Desulfovibrio sp. OttesenSCG-928-G15]
MRFYISTLCLFLSLGSFAVAGPAQDTLRGIWHCDGKAFIQANPQMREKLGASIQENVQKRTGKTLSPAEVTTFLENKFGELTLELNFAKKECVIKEEGVLSKHRFKIVAEDAQSVTVRMDNEDVVFTTVKANAMTMKPKASQGHSMPYIRKR